MQFEKGNLKAKSTFPTRRTQLIVVITFVLSLSLVDLIPSPSFGWALNAAFVYDMSIFALWGLFIGLLPLRILYKFAVFIFGFIIFTTVFSLKYFIFASVVITLPLSLTTLMISSLSSAFIGFLVGIFINWLLLKFNFCLQLYEKSIVRNTFYYLLLSAFFIVLVVFAFQLTLINDIYAQKVEDYSSVEKSIARCERITSLPQCYLNVIEDYGVTAHKGLCNEKSCLRSFILAAAIEEMSLGNLKEAVNICHTSDRIINCCQDLQLKYNPTLTSFTSGCLPGHPYSQTSGVYF
ncbi:hypothetical protein IID27_02290 [Patescibacteria group bacterium]|nr:hypothetical protein [Patescibacteria group bacterium]